MAEQNTLVGTGLIEYSKRMEVQDLNGNIVFYFLYNPSDITYANAVRTYTVEFLSNPRQVTEFLRSGKFQISGRGKFVSTPVVRSSGDTRNTNPQTATGQWKKFQALVRKEGYAKPYFKLHNPFLGDTRTVMFTGFSSQISASPYIIDFSFECVETDIISDEEKYARYSAFNGNTAKFLTIERVNNIEANLSVYLETHSVDEARRWALAGKIPGSAEFQIVEAYLVFRQDISNPDAYQTYIGAVQAILGKNTQKTDITSLKTNALDAVATNGTSTLYTIIGGDTLYGIAKKMYGNSSNANIYTLYQTNKEVIEKEAKRRGYKTSVNGRWIFPGTKISVPSVILTPPKISYTQKRSISSSNTETPATKKYADQQGKSVNPEIKPGQYMSSAPIDVLIGQELSCLMPVNFIVK